MNITKSAHFIQINFIFKQICDLFLRLSANVYVLKIESCNNEMLNVHNIFRLKRLGFSCYLVRQWAKPQDMRVEMEWLTT